MMKINCIDKYSNSSAHIYFKNIVKECDNRNCVVQNKNNTFSSYNSEHIKANFIPSFKNSHHETRKNNFMGILASVETNGKPLKAQISDFSFMDDDEFDYISWGNFLNFFNMDKGKDGRTFLERFLSKNTIEELIYSPEFEPSDVLGIIENMKANVGFRNPKMIFRIIDFVSDVESSKYDAIERTNALVYFLSLKDKDGDFVFKPKNPRISQIFTYKYLMDIDPSSTNASTMEMLLNLVSDGVVDKNVFEFLPVDSKISRFVEQDIDRLYSAYVDGTNPIDAFIPNFESKKEAENELGVGEVFTVDGIKNCYIIVDDKGSSKSLAIDKQTYFDLFPPIKRFATTQNDIGNCWEISVLSALYSVPETRYSVLRLFQQDGDDIKIKFDKGYNSEITYKKGELPQDTDFDVYSNGARGFTLIEDADGKELQAEKIRRYILHIENMRKKDKELAEQKQEELNELLKDGQESIFLEYDYRTGSWDVSKYKNTTLYGYASPETRNRDGGSPFELLYRLGFSQTDELLPDEENVDKVLIDDFEKNIIFWSTQDNLDFYDNFTDNHTYFISSANYDENGNILDYNVVNPWGIIAQRLTLDEMKKYGSGFTYSRKDNCM